MSSQSFLKSAIALTLLVMNAACLQEQVASCTVSEGDESGTIKMCAQFSGIGSEEELRSECTNAGGTYATTTCDTGGAVGSCTNIPSGATGLGVNATVDQMVFQEITVPEEILASDPNFAALMAEMICTELGGTYQAGM
jgi:hypothetical protein